MIRSLFQATLPLTVALLLAGGFYLSLGASPDEFFMPHAHCYLFNKQLMELHGGSDLLIGLSYVSISATLIWLVHRARHALPFHWIMIAFATFIVACGTTHFMELWTLTTPHPRYWLSGWTKLITAIASVTTALVLPPLVPRILGMMEAARISAERGEKLERAHRELNELYAKVTALDQLKTNFFANVSHELRTPLSLIFAPIETLLQSAREQTVRRELTVVRRNALMLHKHVNDLLDVSKLEVGKMELHYTRLDLAAMARSMAGIFESVVSERGIQVLFQTPPEAIAEVDGDKVQRVFMNLLSNAFKYAPDNSAVHLTLAEEGEHITLTVEDAGPGVPVELRTGIFARFQQGDQETQRRFGGTGLGLSIVKEFVEMHGGTVIVGESPAGGAQFRVRLPRQAPGGVEVHSSPWSPTDAVLQRLANAPATLPLVAEEPASIPRESVLPSILVVEDNRDMRDFICRVLEAEGVTRSAENGQAALEAIQQQLPDLIITDMMMPVMTGDELLTSLRQDHQWRDIPVILLTAKADEEMKLNLLTEGAQDYVMKPFSIDELRARVRNQLQTKLTRDTLRRALDTRSADVASMVRELAEAKAAAETANAAKDDLLAVLSHELRTPLTPALAAVSAMMNEPALDGDDLRETLPIIRRNIELEARLVDDLLDVTRIARGKLRIQTQPVDLHAILSEVVVMVEPLFREKQINVQVDLGQAGALVNGDSARLAQVFSNLLTNAAKFTPLEGKVTLRSAFHDGTVVVEVADSGVGITGEMLTQIFTPFRQGEVGTTRRFGGLGLGLSIAKGLVEAHGGRIDVHSGGHAQGTRVTVALPILPSADHTRGAETLAQPSPPIIPSVRILLVEDHEDTRHVLRGLLARWGHTVTTADSVAQAREILARQSFDILLSDIGLPDGSGLDVIAALRETSMIPAIAMSGYGMEGDLARAHAAGFDEHIVKPVSAETLRETVARLTEKSFVQT